MCMRRRNLHVVLFLFIYDCHVWVCVVDQRLTPVRRCCAAVSNARSLMEQVITS